MPDINIDESLKVMEEKGTPESAAIVIRGLRDRQEKGQAALDKILTDGVWAETAEGKRILAEGQEELRKIRDEQKALKEELEKQTKALLRLQAPGSAEGGGSEITPEGKYDIINKSVLNFGRAALGLPPIAMSEKEIACTFMDVEEGTMEEKAVSTLNLARAGVLVMPAEMAPSVVDSAIQEYSDLAGLADEITISAQNLVVPKITAHGSANWHSEGSTRTKDASIKFGTKTFTTYGLNAYFDATREMLMYSKYPLLRIMRDSYGMDFAVKSGAGYVNGSGTGEPEGFTTDTNVASVNQNEADALTNGDRLKKLYFSLKAPYRKNCKWAMNSLTGWTLSILKGGDGHYILRSLNEDQDGKILNREVRYMEDLPDIAANVYPIYIADWKKFYLIVKQAGGEYSIVDPYTSKATGIVEYMYTVFVGGGTRVSEAAKKLKIAAD